MTRRARWALQIFMRMEMSWDQTYNDVFLLDIKTGKPNRILEHFAGHLDVARRQVACKASTRRSVTGFPIAWPTAFARI